VPWEQFSGNLEGLVLVGSEDRRHSYAFGQVSDHVEKQAHDGVVALIVDLKVRNLTPANDWHKYLGLRI